jgi:hypothetical protein
LITAKYSTFFRVKEFAKNLQSSLLSDIQDFVSVVINIIKFFYRRCTAIIESRIFIDAIIEAITYTLFTANEGNVYKLFKILYAMENKEELNEVQV